MRPAILVIHEQGLVSVLRQIHDELDAAVADAYGWPATLTDEEILTRLVALNAERAAEERRGDIRWLRPEFQNAAGTGTQTGLDTGAEKTATPAAAAPTTGKRPWPKTLAEQAQAVGAQLTTLAAPATPPSSPPPSKAPVSPSSKTSSKPSPPSAKPANSPPATSSRSKRRFSARRFSSRSQS